MPINFAKPIEYQLTTGRWVPAKYIKRAKNTQSPHVISYEFDNNEFVLQTGDTNRYVRNVAEKKKAHTVTFLPASGIPYSNTFTDQAVMHVVGQTYGIYKCIHVAEFEYQE